MFGGDMHKILAVDADLYVLECYKDFFTKAGFEIHTAEDATSAMSKFGEIKPDVVILDMDLPGGGGKGVLERLRNIFMSKVPVLFATMNPQEVLDLCDDPNVFMVKKEFKTQALLITIKQALTPEPA